MSRSTFGWSPDLGAELRITPSVSQVKFGDGYELRVSNGINSTPRMWSVAFTRSTSEAMEILTFLQQMEGKAAFNWVDPTNQLGAYVCREWTSIQQAFGIYVVQAVFEQVFEFD